MSDYKSIKCPECLGAKICTGMGGMRKECVMCSGIGTIPDENDIKEKVLAKLEVQLNDSGYEGFVSCDADMSEKMKTNLAEVGKILLSKNNPDFHPEINDGLPTVKKKMGRPKRK